MYEVPYRVHISWLHGRGAKRNPDKRNAGAVRAMQTARSQRAGTVPTTPTAFQGSHLYTSRIWDAGYAGARSVHPLTPLGACHFTG